MHVRILLFSGFWLALAGAGMTQTTTTATTATTGGRLNIGTLRDYVSSLCRIKTRKTKGT